MTFGERLKELREKAELTQAELAERSGVPIGTIRDYEQVKRDPLLPTAVKLARAVGVSIADFEECAAKDERGADRQEGTTVQSTPRTERRGPGRTRAGE